MSYTPHDRELAQGDREDHKQDRAEHVDDRKLLDNDRRLASARRRQEIAFSWLRFVLGIAIAIALAVMIAGYQTRDNAIAACVRNGDSKLIDAEFYAKRGDVVSAVKKRATIPMPNGWRGDPKTRGDSATDRIAGCHDAFPPPIPFVE